MNHNTKHSTEQHIEQAPTPKISKIIGIRVFLALSAGYISTCSVGYLLDLKSEVPFSDSFFACLLFLFLSGWYYRVLSRVLQASETGAIRFTLQRNREMVFSGVFAWFTGILMVAGYQLQYVGYTAPGISGKLQILFRGAFLALPYWPLVWKGFCAKEAGAKQEGARENTADFGKSVRKYSDRKFFSQKYFGCFAVIWLCWIPVWLAYYPVIMSYDFHKQSLEALWGPSYFNNHHPLAHTYLIYLFRCLGEKLGSFEVGFACFCLLQQLITVSILAYACVVIYRLTEKRWAMICSALFFGLFPLISVFVMCTTKDVLFGAFFLLFLLLFAQKIEKNTWKSNLLWIVSGILMVLFRNNALYAMVLFGIFFLLLVPGKRKLQALLVLLLLLGCGKGALWGLQTVFHAYQGSSIEKYSVLYQSMARVGKNQRNNLSEETYTLVDRYVTDSCWEEYNPVLADTIKASVQQVNMNEKKSWDNLGEVVRDWMKIGVQYPNDYLDAFLDLTRGYWFLDDTSHAQMLGTDPEERMGLLYTYNSAAEESLPGMQHRSLFPWLENKMEKLLTSNCYQNWPVFSTLFKPALWCLLLVYAGGYFWCRRDKKGMLLTLYPLSYFATMLLGPTAIVRYVYPFILCAPLLLAYMGRKNK